MSKQRLISNYKLLCKHHTTRRYEDMKNPNDLMLTCADSDFKIPKAMQKDLIKIIKEGDICYSFLDKQLLEAINLWYENHHNLSFGREELVIGSGVIHLIQIALEVLTTTNQGIIVQPPVYDPFFEIINNKKRKIINNDLIYDEETQSYTINFIQLEQLMIDNKVMILCSPHNPVGRVWTINELSKLINLAIKHNVFIISDEIWQDITFPSIKHHPLFTINAAANKQILVLFSQAKTYNLGGTQIGFGLCYNKNIIQQMHDELSKSIHYASTNILSARCIISGYTNKKNFEWLCNYTITLEENYKYLVSQLEQKTDIKVTRIQGTYLGWLNMSKVVKDKNELDEKLADIHLFTINGSVFSKKASLFIRIDFSLDKKILKEVVKRITTIFGKK